MCRQSKRVWVCTYTAGIYTRHVHKRNAVCKPGALFMLSIPEPSACIRFAACSRYYAPGPVLFGAPACADAFETQKGAPRGSSGTSGTASTGARAEAFAGTLAAEVAFVRGTKPPVRRVGPGARGEREACMHTAAVIASTMSALAAMACLRLGMCFLRVGVFRCLYPMCVCGATLFRNTGTTPRTRACGCLGRFLRHRVCGCLWRVCTRSACRSLGRVYTHSARSTVAVNSRGSGCFAVYCSIISSRPAGTPSGMRSSGRCGGSLWLKALATAR